MSATSFRSSDLAPSSSTAIAGSENLMMKNVFSVGGGVSDDERSGVIAQCAQFPITAIDKKNKGLTSIIENLKVMRHQKDKTEDFWISGDTTAGADPLENGTTPTSKTARKRRLDRATPTNNGAFTNSSSVPPSDYSVNNNNNHVKNERLSPGTPDTSSRSRSVTPSSASHPDTPPAMENPMLPRNYSDFMRSLAAKYNNANPNDYFNVARNGFPPPIDARFKSNTFPNLLSSLPTSNKDDTSKKPPDFSTILNPFANSPMFPPIMDMSTTQTLLAMVRTAKEVELQGLLKNTKRTDVSSPLDLSSAAAPPLKRPRIKTPTTGSPGAIPPPKRAESESPRLHEDVSNWTVDDVCNFVLSIDICAEYVQNFRDQLIDGSGLPLLTEEHLTSTMNMKLGPALKLRSILAKKLGSCNICLHCTHCHNSTNSPEPGNNTGNASDSGGTTS